MGASTSLRWVDEWIDVAARRMSRAGAERRLWERRQLAGIDFGFVRFSPPEARAERAFIGFLPLRRRPSLDT